MRHSSIHQRSFRGRLAPVCMMVGSHFAIFGCSDVDESAQKPVDEGDEGGSEDTWTSEPGLLFGSFARSCSDLQMEDNPNYILYAQCSTGIDVNCTCLGHIGSKGWLVKDSSLNLNECMTNKNGDIVWGGRGFGDSCRNVSIRQPNAKKQTWRVAKWDECGATGTWGMKCHDEWSADVAEIHADCTREDGSVWKDSWEDIEGHISNEGGLLQAGCGGR